MTVETVVVWDPLPSQEITDILDAAAAAAALEGKTDNVPEKSEPPAPLTVVRNWTTLADAEEWIALVEQYNPVSATIVQSPPLESDDSPTDDPV
jgi:hypothetical protein